MNTVTIDDIRQLYIPPPDSHKGQNGRMLLIGGSHLFHAASLWALTVASRIVDLVHYASVPENNEIISRVKEEFRNGIVIPRSDIESYIEEDDVILLGPGMVRSENWGSNSTPEGSDMKEIEQINDEGEQTRMLTNYLLKKYPYKQWVIDAGALQMLDVRLIPPHAIFTPHHGEFEVLWKKYQEQEGISDIEELELKIQKFSERYKCIVLHKGVEDIVCNGETGELRRICGGNAGMTKGGTGDVLAGLVAALACKNNPYLATIAGSFINKAAGESLSETVGTYFNSTDLANEIPKVMKKILL